MKKLQDKSVFITGGLSGIGKACALAAVKEGAKVAIAYRKSERSEKRLTEMKVLIPEVVFIECDVSVFDEAEKGIAKAMEGYLGAWAKGRGNRSDHVNEYRGS